MQILSNVLIYLIVNRLNGDRYIGQTRVGYLRFKQHMKGMGTTYFSNAVRKYGAECFAFFPLEYCEVEDLNKKELYWIHRINPEYNTSITEDGYTYTHTEETRKRLSVSVSMGLMGHAVSDEARANMSKAQMGKKLSDETRAAMSASRKGRPRSPETREKIRQSLLGRKRPAEVVQKVADKLRGKPLTPEHIAKRVASWHETMDKRKGQ